MVLNKIKGRLAYKLVIYIVLFSSLITLILTAIQLYVDYQRDIENLNVQFMQIEKSFLPSLSSALWRYNDELIKAQLEGIWKLRDIEYVEVLDARRSVTSMGTFQHTNQLTKEFSLTYLFKGKKISLGTLTVSATFSGIYGRLYQKLIIILLSSAVKIFFTSFFMLILFNILVVRHLKKMADYFQTYSLTDRAEALHLDINKSGFDKANELTRIESEINKLIETIRNSYDTAQEMVTQSTLELERVNEKLKNEIHERKATYKQLRISEEKYRTLVEEINDIIYSTDNTGVVTYISPAVEKLMGYGISEIVGRNFMEFLHPDDYDNIKKRFKEITKDGLLFPYEYRMLSKSGDIHWVRSSSKPIYQGGCIVGLRGVYTDITESKKLEDQLRQAHKMEAIGTLAGGIAHEFNNVLGIILGNTELALDDVPDWNPERDFLEEIRSASLRAKDMVGQILSFARKTMTDLTPLEINTILRESLKMMRATIPSTVEIKTSLPPEPFMIMGNSAEIRQIIMNLCSNADFTMKERGGVLEVGTALVNLDQESASLYEGLVPGNFVKMTIKDSGQGISPEILNKIFEPYFTTKDVGQGTGMGLAVVYGLVKKCNGAIDVRSRMGEGTIVEVLFPTLEETSPAAAGKKDGLPAGKENILLVDDEEPMVKMAVQILERLGYTVAGMSNAVEALKRFRENPKIFDLVITDMAMPHMAGDEFAAELMKIRSDIPVLLCTGHSDNIDEIKARQKGIRGFAMKPLEKSELAGLVREILDGMES